MPSLLNFSCFFFLVTSQKPKKILWANEWNEFEDPPGIILKSI